MTIENLKKRILDGDATIFVNFTAGEIFKINDANREQIVDIISRCKGDATLEYGGSVGYNEWMDCSRFHGNDAICFGILEIEYGKGHGIYKACCGDDICFVSVRHSEYEKYRGYLVKFGNNPPTILSDGLLELGYRIDNFGEYKYTPEDKYFGLICRQLGFPDDKRPAVVFHTLTEPDGLPVFYVPKP